MTLQETAQILGGIGVIASVTYAAIQIRNNARAVRAAAFQQLAASISSQLDDLARNSDLCSLLLRGGDDFESLNRVEKARFRFLLLGHLSRVENAFTQHRIGTLKHENWVGMRNGLIASLEAPGRQAAWQLIKSRLNPDFRDYVDSIVADLAVVQTARPLVASKSKKSGHQKTGLLKS